MTAAPHLTTAELDLLPEDGNRYEIIGGELHVTTQPHYQHQYIAGRVFRFLDEWSDATTAGMPIAAPGVILTPADAVAPDVVWVRRERLAIVLHDDGKLHGAPDLAVEILSPGSANVERDRVTKRGHYGAWGVEEYWIVDRFTQQIEIYRSMQATLELITTLREIDNLTSPLLPGFVCRVGLLFGRRL